MADVSIPEFQGLRSVVPNAQYDPHRRAGSGGQRYFTDVQYTPVPSFRGDRAMYDAQNYLAANADIRDYYAANKPALLEGGDPRFETPEGYAKWHYDTMGKWEPNRPLVPTHNAAGEVIPTPAATAQAANDALALQYKAQNLANPAREGLPSLQRVTDSIINTDIGAIKGADTTERQKINQTTGYMNQNAVSPYRLSTATQIPLADIQAGMHPYYQTEAEQKLNTLPNAGIQSVVQDAITEAQTSPYRNPLRGIPRDSDYSVEEVASVTDLLNSGQVTIEELATYFNRPVEEVRQFYRAQGNRRGFMGGVSYQGGGGVASLNPRGMYLGGPTDGMGDKIPASINNREPARLSDGEFVVPADVVGHLGNGNSDAGAKQLYGMMDRVRRARTGSTEQGRQIDPNKFTNLA